VHGRLEATRRLIRFAATAMLLAGCALGEGRNEDTMEIHNRTDAPIVVTYEVDVNGRVVAQSAIELDPGQRNYVPPGLFRPGRCLPGALVARSGGEVVDRLPQPCREQVWEVMGP